MAFLCLFSPQLVVHGSKCDQRNDNFIGIYLLFYLFIYLFIKATYPHTIGLLHIHFYTYTASIQ